MSVNCVSYSPDGNNIVSSSDDYTIKIWDAKTGKLPKSLEGHTNNIISHCCTPDGNNIVSGSYDRTIKIWDIKSGQ